MEKGPPSPLRLPSPFPKLLFWSLAGGVTPQAEKDGQSPGEDGGRHDWPCSGIKSARSQRPGAFALAGWGTGQAVFPPLCTMASTWGSRGRQSRGRRRGVSLFLAKRRFKREEPGQFLTGLLSSGGPSSEDGDLHADLKKRFWKGGERPARGGPQGRARYDEGSYGHRELAGGRTFSPKRFPSPLSFLFESDVTTYSCARPMPGRAASRSAPRRKRPASSKALPMSCMPTGILLSAAMPTGRDRPGRPARFRDRV